MDERQAHDGLPTNAELFAYIYDIEHGERDSLPEWLQLELAREVIRLRSA